MSVTIPIVYNMKQPGRKCVIRKWPDLTAEAPVAAWFELLAGTF